MPAQRSLPEQTGGETATAKGAVGWLSDRLKSSMWAPIERYFLERPAAILAAGLVAGALVGWLVKRR